MNFELTGGAYPLLNVQLAPGETFEAEVRAFVGLIGEAEIKSQPLRPSKQNIKAAVGGKKRVVTTRFKAVTATRVLLTSGIAGEICTPAVPPGLALRAAPGAYIASEDGVTMGVEVVRFSKTSRMPLLSFSGEGRVFLGASGAAHANELGPGAVMTIDRAHLLACDGGLVIEDVSEGGLWPTITGQDLIKLTGPGRVILQTLPRAPRSSPLTDAVKAVSGLL